MICLPSKITHANATQIRDEGVKSLRQQGIAQSIFVDAKDLVDFDSSILALLLAWRRVTPALIIKAAPQKLQKLARVYGVSDLLTFREA